MWFVPVLIPGILAPLFRLYPSWEPLPIDDDDDASSNQILNLRRGGGIRGDDRVQNESAAAAVAQKRPYPNTTENLSYDTRYYHNTVDHVHPFSKNATFSHRYLINDTYFGHSRSSSSSIERRKKNFLQSDDCPGPIFLYAGNEGDITGFWDANGFLQYLAVEYGGLLLFPEERYYGDSIPSPTNDKRYLTTQQVLEDYVELLDYVKTEYRATSCPTIAFGGSYGGTLAAFLRSAYPFAIQGALAASSELGYYDREGWASRGITEYTFAEIVAKQYNKTEGCLEAIWDVVALMDGMADDADERRKILKEFNFCNESALEPSPSSLFVYGLEGLPQQNYPYPVGSHPAWPVQTVCRILTAKTGTDDLLRRAAEATALSMGYSLDGPCLNTPEEGPGNVPGDGPGLGSWGYQSCTETLHMFSSSMNNSGYLGLRHYDFTDEVERLNMICQDLYQVYPDTAVLKMRYGGFDIAKTTSNTIFSSGRLDPWGGAALTENDGGADAVDRGVYFFTMENGAHHLDLRGWNGADPSDVSETRRREEEIIVGWIKDWFRSSSTVRAPSLLKQ